MTDAQRTTRWFLVRLIICVLLLAGIYAEAGSITAVAIGLVFVRTELFSLAINRHGRFESFQTPIQITADIKGDMEAGDLAAVIAQRLKEA